MIATLIAKRKVKSVFKSLNERKIDGIVADWAEETVFSYPGNTFASGTIIGKIKAKEWFQELFNTFSTIIFQVIDICVSRLFDFGGNNVITVCFRVKVNNSLNQEFDNLGITHIRIKKRKAIEVRDFFFNLDQLQKAWIRSES